MFVGYVITGCFVGLMLCFVCVGGGFGVGWCGLVLMFVWGWLGGCFGGGLFWGWVWVWFGGSFGVVLLGWCLSVASNVVLVITLLGWVLGLWFV